MASNGREDDFAFMAQALPTPTDTPYRTPARSRSRHSSHNGNGSPISSSAAPLPSGAVSKDPVLDEMLSFRDPRRFTPTLHANLVNAILNLRREIEDRDQIIEDMETSLHNQRADYEILSDELNKDGKEKRSLQRQLRLLEGGTSSALGELARERDEAVDSQTEIKRRLEASQKKVRSLEESADRTQMLWEKDKDSWDNERRGMERKVHAAESRMKKMLEEVTAHHEAVDARNRTPIPGVDSEAEEAARDSGFGHDSETGSIRSVSLNKKRPQSSTSTEGDFSNARNSRYSSLNGINGFSGAKAHGPSLADELDFDEEDEDHLDETEELATIEGATVIKYIDAGIQFSAPPSPQLRSSTPAMARVESHDERPSSVSENEPNQSRKRVSMAPSALDQSKGLIKTQVPALMVSSSSQTLEQPATAAGASRPLSPEDLSSQAQSPVCIEMKSVSTQTDAAEIAPPKRAAPPTPIPIPSIAVYPPTSAPTTPGVPLLPVRTQDAACQVSMPTSQVPMRSTSVQTEEIRVPKRMVILPPNLQPSAISSSPPPTPESRRSGSPTQRRKIARGSRQRLSNAPPSSPPPAAETEDAYPGHNDNAFPAAEKTSRFKRPFRKSSLFTAGFDRLEFPSSDEVDEFEPEVSDSDYRTPLSAPKPRRRQSKRLSSPPKSVPEDEEPVTKFGSNGSNASFSLKFGATKNDLPTTSKAGAAASARQQSKSKQLEKPGTATIIKQPNIRKSALISSGAAAHSQRARSPSLGEIFANGINMPSLKQPIAPFPIPTRSSSRNVPWGSSDGTHSPQSGSAFILSGYRNSGRDNGREGSLRKVRSAAAIPQSGRRDRTKRSRSPPPLSVSSSLAPDSPQLPPMPKDEITNPRYAHGRHREGHRPQASTNTSNTGGASLSSSTNQVSVVDAIAQTMVGEWMYKYTRRKKSFGVSDSPKANWDGQNVEDVSANITGNGVRHKRWVWLAPYEHAIMWSSKQPTTGPALLGKSGRKLVIQSVLDVKDDTPAPRGASPLFGRSILILTPARALKFTATSRERHYLWVQALSFLALTSQGPANDLATLPPLPPQPSSTPDFGPAPPPPTTASLRRNPIRDSIRVAKGKPRPTPADRFQQPTAIQEVDFTYGGGAGFEDPISTAAEPPIVPRFSTAHHGHGRKRSNTGPRELPRSAFRHLTSYPAPTSANTSVGTFTTSSADMHVGGSTSNYGGSTHAAAASYSTHHHATPAGLHSGQSSISGRRTSEASGSVMGAMAPRGGAGENFFDAVGTVRMEAFVSRAAAFDPHLDEYAGGAASRDRARGARRAVTASPGGLGLFPTGPLDSHPAWDREDPFRGF